MAEKGRPKSDIQPGMEAEAMGGDLGEEDVSKPKVTEVVEGTNGDVKKLVVEKGKIFKKKLEIPAERVDSVDPDSIDATARGKVRLKIGQEEEKALTAIGAEELAPENQGDLLDKVERVLPTTEGMREMEALNDPEQAALEGGKQPPQTAQEAESDKLPVAITKPRDLFKVLGPGFLSGVSGNDSTAVAAYAIDGATVGYGHLWLMLLLTPLLQVVVYSCSKIGTITQKGLTEVLREHYGRWIAIGASLVLIAANVALIAGNLVAIGSGMELLTGIAWPWFVIPVGGTLWYLTVYRSFEAIKKLFIIMSLVFISYPITALFSGAQWGTVLVRTFVPHIDPGFVGISGAVALSGATISPYTMFWQAQSEKEQKRRGTIKQRARLAALDIASGVLSGNLVAYCIIICTAATLFTHHESIRTAADAAKALVPILGPFAEYLFAIGLIGAGLVAVPVLLASTSYAVAGTFGWPASLSKKPWQNEGFYLILTAALIVSLIIALLRFDPVQLMFWSNVLCGVLAPILVIYIIMVGNNRKIMRGQRLGVLNTICLAITALVMFAAVGMLFYGIITGQA